MKTKLVILLVEVLVDEIVDDLKMRVCKLRVGFSKRPSQQPPRRLHEVLYFLFRVSDNPFYAITKNAKQLPSAKRALSLVRSCKVPFLWFKMVWTSVFFCKSRHLLKNNRIGNESLPSLRSSEHPLSFANSEWVILFRSSRIWNPVPKA